MLTKLTRYTVCDSWSESIAVNEQCSHSYDIIITIIDLKL